jgi:hypothetical protein
VFYNADNKYLAKHRERNPDFRDANKAESTRAVTQIFGIKRRVGGRIAQQRKQGTHISHYM